MQPGHSVKSGKPVALARKSRGLIPNRRGWKQVTLLEQRDESGTVNRLSSKTLPSCRTLEQCNPFGRLSVLRFQVKCALRLDPDPRAVLVRLFIDPALLREEALDQSERTLVR